MIKAAIVKVVGISRSDYSDLNQEEIHKTCEQLGFTLSPYMAVEAHLVSHGGFKSQGKGPFDMQKLLGWLRQRENIILPVKVKEYNSTIDHSSSVCGPRSLNANHSFRMSQHSGGAYGSNGLPRIKGGVNSRLRGVNHSLDATSTRNLGKFLGNEVGRTSVTSGQ